MTIIENYNLIIKLVGQRVLEDASSGNEGVILVESLQMLWWITKVDDLKFGVDALLSLFKKVLIRRASFSFLFCKQNLLYAK